MKRTFLALVCAAMMLPAAAQWNPGDYNMSLIQQDDSLEFYHPVMIRKADGSTLLAYKSLGRHINPSTHVKDPDMYFYLHMQKLDKDGNKQFPEGGVLISSQPTESASYSLIGMDTLSNGNVVLTHADIRDELVEQNLHVYAYCYTQQGEPVWSKDGVKLPVCTPEASHHNPRYLGEKLAVSGDKIYVTAVAVEKSKSMGGKDVLLFEVACLDYNGNILKSRVDTVYQSFNYAIKPAPDGKLYIVYVNDKDGYSARCIDADCKDVWAQPTVVETFGVVRYDGTSVYAEAPSEMIPLSDGSLALVYYAFPAKQGIQLFYNRLYKDGKVFDQHVLISDTIGQHVEHTCMIDGDTLSVFECHLHDVSSEQEEFYYYFNRVLLDGTPLYTTPYGVWIDETVNMWSEMLGVVKAGGKYQLLTSILDQYYQTRRIFSYTFGLDGKKIFRKPILGEFQISTYDFIGEDNLAYLSFTKDIYGSGGLWIACINTTDYANSAPETGELPGKFTINAEGQQVVFSQANLQYMPFRPVFHFATKQWHALVGNNEWLEKTNINWIDLFGWGTGDKGDKISTSAADYATYNEWGNNPIQNSSYEAGTWRTMSEEEWKYLFESRKDAASKRAMGSIVWHPYAPIDGIILLPDQFEMPKGIEMNMNATTFDVNQYVPLDWMLLEANGAVFLPLGSYRDGTKVASFDTYNRASTGYYWTSTDKGNTEAMRFKIDSKTPSFAAHNRSTGMSVRLVKDAGSSPSRIEDVPAAGKDNSARKVIMNGALYIIRDGKIYDAQGARVR